MAEKKKTIVDETTPKAESIDKTIPKAESTDMEPVFIPKERNDKPNAGEWVCVNGKPFLIKKGETVMVPKAVAEVIKHSTTARERAAEYKANAAKA